MELKVKSDSIRSERKARAWSQEHLAHVSGVGTRTVQRIESSGVASYESVQAIAAALDMPAQELIAQSTISNAASIGLSTSKRRIAIFVTSILAIASFFVVRTVTADQVMLEVGVSINEELKSEAGTVTDEGEEASIEFADGYRLLIAPTIDAGEIVLELQLFKHDGDDYVRIAKPRIVTTSGETARLRSAVENDDIVDIRITPTLQ